jgi:hypothetical protein
MALVKCHCKDRDIDVHTAGDVLSLNFHPLSSCRLIKATYYEVNYISVTVYCLFVVGHFIPSFLCGQVVL